jgi:malate dehydrogenase (quinone)
VQVIRPHKRRGGALEFDTTVLSGADGSIAGLLGASPGASTAVSAMLEVLQRCYADRYLTWLPILKEMVPSLGAALSDEPVLFEELRSWTNKALALEPDCPPLSRKREVPPPHRAARLPRRCAAGGTPTASSPGGES